MVSLLRQVVFLELVQLFPGKIIIDKDTADETDNDKEDVMDVEGLENDKTSARFVYHKLFFAD